MAVLCFISILIASLASALVNTTEGSCKILLYAAKVNANEVLEAAFLILTGDIKNMKPVQ